MSNWVKALQKARMNGADQVPEGWLRIEELPMGLKSAQTYKLVEDLCRQGLAEKKKFRVQCGSLLRGRFHYRLK